MNIKYISILAVVVLAFSCAKPEASQMVSGDSISLSQDNIELDYNSGAYVDVKVQTEGEWVVEGLTDGVRSWLSLSAEAGVDTTVVRVATMEENVRSSVRAAVIVLRSGDAAVNMVVKQIFDPERTISLSKESISMGGQAGEEAEVALQTPKIWTIEGYDEQVQAWLEVSPSSGEGNSLITLRTKTVNEGPDIREAVLGFRIDAFNCVWLNVTQDVFIETRTIYWNNTTILAPEGAAYKAFPYYTDNAFTANGIYYDGKNGEQMAVGSINEVRTYLLKNVGTQDQFECEFGPTVTPTAALLSYYCHNNNNYIRVRNAYIKTPVIEGFKLTHVTVTGINAASVSCMSISSDYAGVSAIDGISKVKFGKPDPIDVELTQTEVDTPYYISSNNDRFIESIKLTYTKAR